MHAKEKPDAAEIKLQNELYGAYDTQLRKGITEGIASDMAKATPIDSSVLSKMRGSSFSQQFKQLLTRAFRNLTRSKQLTQARIFQTVIIAIVLDILFFRKTGYDQQTVRSKSSVLFFLSMTQLMGTLNSVVLSCIPLWIANCDSPSRTRTVPARIRQQDVQHAAILPIQDRSRAAVPADPADFDVRPGLLDHRPAQHCRVLLDLR